jgi:hypothetical protein
MSALCVQGHLVRRDGKWLFEVIVNGALATRSQPIYRTAEEAQSHLRIIMELVRQGVEDIMPVESVVRISRDLPPELQEVNHA